MLNRDLMLLATTLFALAVLTLAYATERWALAVYALSFWYYLVYVLAFFWRRITLQRFIRDSVLLKTLSLAALASVLWTTLPNPVSIIVMVAGFALSIAATRALGTERTYYGFELAALAPKRITSFPYSLTAHPMLIGSMLAFGGTLLDETFLRAWWPLGLLHVALSLLIILMEAYGAESQSAGKQSLFTGFALGAILLLVGFLPVWPYALAMVVISGFFGAFIIHRYA
ncbi:MAG: methyltransferase [Geminicoccaceae bacterium]